MFYTKILFVTETLKNTPTNEIWNSKAQGGQQINLIYCSIWSVSVSFIMLNHKLIDQMELKKRKMLQIWMENDGQKV